MATSKYILELDEETSPADSDVFMIAEDGVPDANKGEFQTVKSSILDTPKSWYEREMDNPTGSPFTIAAAPGTPQPLVWRAGFYSDLSYVSDIVMTEEYIQFNSVGLYR